MPTMEEAAKQFLTHKRIAVTGVSRKGDTAANGIYRKLRDKGYAVFAVNPHAETLEGDACYPNLASIPDGVEAVVVATPPQASAEVVRECGRLGIRNVWIHRSFGQGSYDEEAVRLCGELGISVIPGMCPMMFCEPVDIAHKCFRWYMKVSGKVPEVQSA